VKIIKKGRYGVVVCSNCKHSWGIDLSHKNSKCTKCNKIYSVKKLKILYRTSNLKELQKAIAKIQEKIIK
jgi:hypothetical protein